jgi:1-deoxy-D-xylulose-5-phosphate synthase
MGLLEQIDSPADLKKLKPEDFPALAAEIRELIIQVVSKTGGHLSSNLGVVELTMVLHYLFDTPKDQIVWDTSNQTYTHKLLTGRQKDFPTLRQYDGLSGFAKREESIYDVFNAGHAGTGLSAAVGLVEARDLRGEDYKVICVVGDGALTAGMSYEGLNHAGASKKDLLVILNDNEMSISKNVGALSAYLNRIITGQFVTRLKAETKSILRSIPRIGESVIKAVEKVEESAKGLIGPGILFEELGFQYVGPIDGHNLTHLLETLENVKKLKGPILMHVITKKGLGYEPAERDSVFFHSAPSFIRETGEPRKRSSIPSYTTIFSNTLIKLAKQDKRIVGITAAMCDGTGLGKFAKEFPDRYYDVGIAEQHAVTFAAGLAVKGMKPMVGIYSTFLQRAYDQILHDVCVQNLPVVLCIDRGGLVAEDGTTHHGVFDYAYLRHIPNMAVMAPKDENELQHMIKTAVDYPGPIALRYPRGNGVGVALDKTIQALPIGQGELLLEGDELAIIAIGYPVHQALEAARILEESGIRVTVVNARFVKPLDHALISQVAQRSKYLITVEEHALQGGFGSAVLECLADEGISHLSIRRIGIPDHYIEQGPQDLLRQKYGITAGRIVAEARELLASGQKSRRRVTTGDSALRSGSR